VMQAFDRLKQPAQTRHAPGFYDHTYEYLTDQGVPEVRPTGFERHRLPLRREAMNGRRLRPAKPAGKVRGIEPSPIWSSRTASAYLDGSALLKRYLLERGSRETLALTADSETVATSIVSRAEVAAAFAKATRTGR
jgi:hypothetical protein